MRKYLIISIITLLFISCERHHLSLKDNKNQNAILFQNDFLSIYWKGSLGGIDTFLGAKEVGYTPSYNSKFLEFILYIGKTYDDSVVFSINKMNVNIWSVDKDSIRPLTDGKIDIYKKKNIEYDNLYPIDLKDTIKNYEIKSYYLKEDYLAVIKVDNIAKNSKEFIIETYLDGIINENKISVYKKDTVYRTVSISIAH